MDKICDTAIEKDVSIASFSKIFSIKKLLLYVLGTIARWQ